MSHPFNIFCSNLIVLKKNVGKMEEYSFAREGKITLKKICKMV